MKNTKYIFWISLISNILLCVISAIFEFENATGGYLMSSILIIEIHYALTPLKTFGPRNPLKRHYQRRNNLKKYKRIMIRNFVVFFVLGSYSLIQDIINRLA